VRACRLRRAGVAQVWCAKTRVACAWRRDGHLVEEKALFAVFGGVMWLHLSGGARGFRGCVGELARLLLSDPVCCFLGYRGGYGSADMCFEQVFQRGVVLAVLLLAVGGCERAELAEWGASEQSAKLPEELRSVVTAAVRREGGTVLEPRFAGLSLPDSEADRRRQQLHLRHGQAVYLQRCVHCHGVSGAGDGLVAASLYPRPRDYTRGVFKFTSTSYGSKPRREDLVQTLVRGIAGTSMPSFRLLSKRDVEAVVDYVLVLSRRGELEFLLASEAEAAEELEEDSVADYVETVRGRWQEAGSLATQPLTPQPELTAERVVAGREAFLTKGCSKCHGEDGRGHTKDNIGRDVWGHATRAADLTSGMLRGGQEPIDIYRRILNGINGTPMPGFRGALESEPETLWNLVSYVLEVSGRRREETLGGKAEIPAGLLKPYAEPAAVEGESSDASSAGG